MVNFGLDGLAVRPRFAGSPAPALIPDPRNLARTVVRLTYRIARKRRRTAAQKRSLEEMVKATTAGRPGVRCFRCGFQTFTEHDGICGVCIERAKDDEWLATPEGQAYAKLGEDGRRAATKRTDKYGRVWHVKRQAN